MPLPPLPIVISAKDRDIGKMRVFEESVSTLSATDCLMAVSKRSLIWKRFRHVKRLKGSNKEENNLFLF